jgi:hypothetical protein
MIELFSRKIEALLLPDNAVLGPLPLGDELSSLSAILMDNDYYQFLRGGRIQVDEVPILDAAHIIPLKAKAWLDLSAREKSGENIDAKNIRKHKNDVFRISALLTPETRVQVPSSIKSDISAFVASMEYEQIDVKNLGIRNETQADILAKIAAAYIS